MRRYVYDTTLYKIVYSCKITISKKKKKKKKKTKAFAQANEDLRCPHICILMY